MECAIVGLVVIVSLIGMAIAMLSGGRGGQWNDGFAHVARRFHGMLHPGGWLHWVTRLFGLPYESESESWYQVPASAALVSSVVKSQSSSRPLQYSVALGWTFGLVSRQSPLAAAYPGGWEHAAWGAPVRP